MGTPISLSLILFHASLRRKNSTRMVRNTKKIILSFMSVCLCVCVSVSFFIATLKYNSTNKKNVAKEEE